VRTAQLLAATLAAATLTFTAGAALAQHHAGQPPPEFVAKAAAPTEHHRRGEVNAFGAQSKAPERPFPWRAVALALGLCALASPFAYLVFRSTAKDLDDLKTVGRATEAKKGVKPQVAAGPDALGGGTARDRVLEAVTSVNQWVPVDWVAQTAGLSVPDATDELHALADDGQIEHASDRSGKPIFRNLA
jgi:hypothetical protein